jgi:hypothetical protein
MTLNRRSIPHESQVEPRLVSVIGDPELSRFFGFVHPLLDLLRSSSRGWTLIPVFWLRD